MDKKKVDLFFIIGIVLFSITNIIRYSIGTPIFIEEFLSGAGCGLMIFGAIRMLFPRSFENSKFRQWKLRLLEKRNTSK